MTKLFSECSERTIGTVCAVISAPIDSARPQAGLPLLQGGDRPAHSQPAVVGGTADEAMPRRRTRAVPRGDRLPRRARARAAIESAMGVGTFRAFRRDRRGSVAVEIAVPVALPAISLAGIVQIVHSAHVHSAHVPDRTAGALSLSPDADDATQAVRAREAVWDEPGLDGDFDCKAGLALDIHNLLTVTLPREPDSDSGDPDGHLVAVRVARSTGPWTPGEILTDEDEDTRHGAIGIARLEPAKGG